MKKLYLSLIIFIFSLIIYAFFVPYENWSSQSVQESMKRGDDIVKHLEEYKKKNGFYPINLQDLGKKIFSNIPAPIAGDKTWQYQQELSGKSFNLRVGTKNLEDGHILMRDHRYWIHDTQ
ncbi:hypothetical protein [Catenovulum maritimum]|uniref:Type II secretion system protein GspG C-terminal domain-containing protein n=1 Tax=Catenovulum maritimum TaxID=1513271 RepID=A0A0J8GMZ3_9ALTE|nr:hypothetical protein [Catenovulum maritimum]KMT64155.1 hypothetical protein XM47_15915 [Catenovulum maritimum]